MESGSSSGITFRKPWETTHVFRQLTIVAQLRSDKGTFVTNFKPDPVGDIPTRSQTGLRPPQASVTNNQFPQTAMADFCFFFFMVDRGWIWD